MDVTSILLKENISQELIIAGILHDTVEDFKYTKVTALDIEKKFGKNITKLVMSVTDDKEELDWKKRKQKKIQSLKNASKETLIIKCADALANIRDINADAKQYGNKVWTRFNADKKGQAWYYKELLKTFSKIKDKQMYKQFKLIVNEMFPDIDTTNHYTYCKECKKRYKGNEIKTEVWSSDDGGDSYECCPKGHQIN